MGAVLALLVLGTGSALAAQRPVVVQLFTSLGCSDCPPADALLARIGAGDHDVLVLDLHVTYWNNASWADPYALRGADRLQSSYAALRHDSQVYTPEVIVDGGPPFIGSNAPTMAAAIAQAKERLAQGRVIPASITLGGRGLAVSIGTGRGTARLWLFGFEAARTTRVQAGENAGATISEMNVVSSITDLGEWRGQGLRLDIRPPAGAKFAVVLQRADGQILAAAST
jgi:hypothetical protein